MSIWSVQGILFSSKIQRIEKRHASIKQIQNFFSIRVETILDWYEETFKWQTYQTKVQRAINF